MARFARIDKNNTVQSVHVVDNEHLINEHGNEEEDFGITYLNKIHGVGFTWMQSSYNTRGGIHYGSDGNPDDKIPLRKNHAGPGFTYDKERDAFIPPQIYDSWTLNEDTCQWEAPKAYPDDDKDYEWNEDNETWESSKP